MQTILDAYAWIKDNPASALQALFAIWAVANVVWAQWPQPKSPLAMKVWAGIHHGMQLIATSAQAAGTFTWPSLVRILLYRFLVPTINPFAPISEKTDGAQDPSPAADAPGGSDG